jgi:phosphate transport system substrate-binding protein
MAVGAVKNRDGNFVTPDISTVSDAAAGAASTLGPDTDFRISLINAPGERTYPVASFTWLLVRKDFGDDAAKAKALVEFIWWALTQGQHSAEELGYAPLPQAIMPLVEAHLRQVSAGSAPVWDGATTD